MNIILQVRPASVGNGLAFNRTINKKSSFKITRVKNYVLTPPCP